MPENSFIELEVNDKKECFINCGEKISKKIQAKDETTYPNIISINKENKIIINELKLMDGYIISIVNENIKDNDIKKEIVIPGSSLEEVYKFIKGEINKDIYIYINDKNVAFEFNNTILTSIIIPNTYIDTDRIFNIEYSTKINLNKNNFIMIYEKSILF